MKDTSVPAFTVEDVRQWERDIRTNVPPELRGVDLPLLPSVTALGFGVTSYGLAIRYVTDAGSTADIFINPVVAQALIQSIRGLGQQWGWIAPDGTLSIPLVPPQDRRPV